MFERDWVLVVSESEQAPFRVRAAILEWGFAVEVETTLAEAERRLATRRPTAVFLDDELLRRHDGPVPHGLTYAALGVPTVLLSADDAEGPYRRAAELGAMDVIKCSTATPEEIRFRFTAALARHTILADRSASAPETSCTDPDSGHRPQAMSAMWPGRVLLVEDSEAIRLTGEKTLRGGGHEVVSCATAEDALEIMGRESFDVLCTDLGLPGMDGAKLAAVAKEMQPALQVVLLTGRAGEATAGNTRGAIDFVLSKPCSIDEILETVGRAIRGARAA